jgi:hypothetical protein
VLGVLDEALERLGGERYAVRSSAGEEDSAQHSLFCVRDWLKARPITYLWTHMLIMPLVDL